MKAEIEYDSITDEITLLVIAENDLEELALKKWGEKFFYLPIKGNGAYLIIESQRKAKNV